MSLTTHMPGDDVSLLKPHGNSPPLLTVWVTIFLQAQLYPSPHRVKHPQGQHAFTVQRE